MLKRFRSILIVATILLPILFPPTSFGDAQSYAVGDKGPSGGPIIFVDKYDDYSWDYIEAAPSDWMGSQSNSALIRWSPFGSSAATLATLSSTFGDGAKNTAAILSTFGSGWTIKSIVRDLNDCPYKDEKVKFCNIILTFNENHGVTRFDQLQWPVLPVTCDSQYVDSIANSLTGEIKVLSPKSISFVENGYTKSLADKMLVSSNCKITYAAELASSSKIGGNSGWVLPTLDELALVQRIVGTNRTAPFVIDQNILRASGYVASYYSTSTLRDSATQRVWGFTHETIAGKGGVLALTYGAPVLPIRYFKTSVPLVGLGESAPLGPTTIEGQIIQEDTRWYAKSSPFKIKGTIQIPAGVTLTIQPGTRVDLTEGNFTLLGNLVIGNNNSTLPTYLTLGYGDLIAKGNGGNLTIENTEIKGSNSVINSMWNASLATVTIDNSILEGFRNVVAGTTNKLTISNSILRKFETITDLGSIYNFSLTNSVLENLKTFAIPSTGIYVNVGQGSPTSAVTGNVFLNDSTTLNFTLPQPFDSSLRLSFSNNRFETPKNLVISGGSEAGSNYWGAANEAGIRASAKVIDGKSDITLKTINFGSILTSAPTAPAKYQVLLDRIAAEKAAAEKAAADALLTPPPTDVSCSIDGTGLSCSNSITVNRTWNTVGSTNIEWYISLLKPGLDPIYTANYGAKSLFVKSAAGRVTDVQLFTYEKLLAFAGSNPDSTILVNAVLVNGDGKSWPTIGKGVFVPLKDIKAMVDKALLEKAQAEAKAAAEKAAAEARAKVEAEAKAQAEKAAAEAKARIEAEAKAAAEKAAQAKAASKKVTITCVKGKVTKKVTGVNPKCPSGYKKK